MLYGAPRKEAQEVYTIRYRVQIMPRPARQVLGGAACRRREEGGVQAMLGDGHDVHVPDQRQVGQEERCDVRQSVGASLRGGLLGIGGRRRAEAEGDGVS